MALPKQIQKQADAVAEYDKQVAQQATQPPAEQAAEAPPASEPNPSPEQPAPAATTTVEAKPRSDDWEQKYRSLFGMIERENRDKQLAQQQLQQATERIAALEQQLKAKQEPPKPSALVTEKDVEAFGSDLVDMARRVAREEFGQREQTYLDRIAVLERQLTQQVGEVQQTQQQSSREGFLARLGQAIPTWETVQATDQCQQWLASRVPGASFTWNDVLLDAAQKFDASRAIEVFNTFIATQKPATPPQPAPSPRARSELSRQVAPNKTNATQAQSTTEKRIYSGADYEAESQQVIRLTKAGRYDDAARIEQELNAALLEGRIRP